MYLMSEVPLYTSTDSHSPLKSMTCDVLCEIFENSKNIPCVPRMGLVQGYFAHKKHPPPLRSP